MTQRLLLLGLASASPLALSSPAPPARPALSAPPVQQVPVFRSGVDLVNLAVTVTDKKGHLVTDLSRSDFGIVEDGKAQTVSYFASGDATAAADAAPPMHLGLLIDTSES